MELVNNTLTKCQIKVLKELVKGRSNKQIAYSLGIETGTVKFHLTNVYKALPVKNRGELIRYLVYNHILE